MKKLLFALAFIACFAFGTSEYEKFEKECNDGNIESCYKAGLLCEDNATSFKLFEKACNGGCEEGCLSASEIIMQEDSKKASDLLKKIVTRNALFVADYWGSNIVSGSTSKKIYQKG